MLPKQITLGQVSKFFPSINSSAMDPLPFLKENLCTVDIAGCPIEEERRIGTALTRLTLKAHNGGYSSRQAASPHSQRNRLPEKLKTHATEFVQLKRKTLTLKSTRILGYGSSHSPG